EKAIQYLKNWDCDLSRESTAAAIFEMWYHHLIINLLENVLGKELLENYYIKKQGNNYDAFGIPRLLQYPENFWIQGDSNSNEENLSKLLSKSLQEAIETLQKMLGDDMSSWAWGKIHTANFAHPLGIIPPYDLVLNVMDVPTPGDENCINNGIFYPNMDPKTGFKQVGLPSTRIIVDLSNFSNSVNMHTTGQSGHPASKHYSDMCYPWANVEYHKVLYDKKLIEKEAEMELKLVPK
ncbi:MAG: penicillin acylase family protein, partial [Promethearchaeota archaeon]